jgi:branched-chain amino acid aminotransferase
MMAQQFVHLNGQVIPAEDARISIFDAGLLHGASAFTTMLAHNGRIFRLDRHLARLMETVELLSLRTDAAPEGLAAAAYELLAANELSEARLRITLTPGSPREQQPTTLVTAEPVANPPQWYEKGISMIVSSQKQIAGAPIFGTKTGCYLPRILGRQEAAAKGADEALWFTPDNRLAEACFCNVFLVQGGKIVTPPLDTPVLAGVVRQAVLELCGELQIPCDDKTPLNVKHMLGAQEIFVTSSVSGVRPVTAVERHEVSGGKVGPISRRIMDAYAELLDRECPPAASPQAPAPGTPNGQRS